MTKIYSTTRDKKNFLARYSKLITFVILGLTVQINAQENESTNQFKIDFFKTFDSSCEKILKLADSIPSELYVWRPTDEIRSIHESLLHVASTHYYLASILKYPIPEGVKPREFKKSIKTKKDVKETLLNSIKHIRTAIQKIGTEQLHAKVEFFGNQETMQRVILQVGEHMAEHLGQLIVYARMKEVTPPWSK